MHLFACYHVRRALSEQNNAPSLVRAKCFHTLDAFVRLIALLVKHSGTYVTRRHLDIRYLVNRIRSRN